MLVILSVTCPDTSGAKDLMGASAGIYFVAASRSSYRRNDRQGAKRQR